MNKTNYIDDIEFARPAKEKPRCEVKNILDTTDINMKKKILNTLGRNPQNPEYIIKGVSKNELI